MIASSIHKKTHRFLVLALLVGLVFMPLSSGRTAPNDYDPAPSSGIVCTTNPSATFTLAANAGFISMTDGNTVYTWSYAEGKDDFQFPGPVLCVEQGQTVTVVLHNNLPEPTSIIFPGQENVMANNAPAQPQFGVGGLESLVQTAPPGESITYSFVAAEPGTYIYQSGTNPDIQVQMGLYGALVVRPLGHPTWAYNQANTEFKPTTEYLILLSEIDPLLHQAVERGESFDMRSYQARYFLINGRTFPDTLAPNFASWLPAQPYSALAHIHPEDQRQTIDGQPNPAYNPLPALARYVGVGMDVYPFHPHAFNGRIIARDGKVLTGPAGEDLSYEKFSINVGPGQTLDSLFSWKDTYGWKPDDANNQIPVDLPQDQNLVFGPFWGSAYLGNQDVLPVGTASLNQCGEFYHIAHNHALQQITGWGVVLIGQVTFTRIDPPLPNNCP